MSLYRQHGVECNDILLLLFTITVQLQFEDYVQIKTTITKQSKGYTES